jgi:hypothetical protein
VIMLWFTQITKKIFGTNPIKIIFKSFIQSQLLGIGISVPSLFVLITFIGEPSLLKRLRTFLASMAILMSTHVSVLVDSVGPPSAEVCRTAASFP